MATYFWRYGNLPVPAQVAGEYMKELEQKYKELTPQIILEESRPADAILHNCFEWDNGKAAENYRLYQAGHIIRNISVRIEKIDTPTQISRAFVNIKDESKQERGAYVSVEIAMQNENLKNQVLQNAFYELLTFEKKYSAYTEFAKVFSAIDELKAKFLTGKNL